MKFKSFAYLSCALLLNNINGFSQDSAKVIPENFLSTVSYKVGAEAVLGWGDFSPYFFASNRHGVTSLEPTSGYLRGSLIKSINENKFFDYGAGIGMIGRFNRKDNAWLQQLYAEVKLSYFTLSGGMKEIEGRFKNFELSSGGLIWSGNSTPIPQLRLEMNKFYAVPLTNGWLQVLGSVSYGKYIDDKWLEDNYTYDQSFITTGSWYHQKQFYLRSKEDKNFIVTLGGEFACQFGGDQEMWSKNGMYNSTKSDIKLKDFLHVLIPKEGNDGVYYLGDHLGSWHGVFEYKFKNESRLKGYFEWLFEDGSGIGKLNGWDGLWGLEFNLNKKWYITDVVVEYLQTTNQSGPMHYAPDDFPGYTVNSQATGADDYYNNYYYNGWTHRGTGLGSPLLLSTAYHKNGHLRYIHNRIQAYHLGVNGYIINDLQYWLLMS